MRTLDAVAVAVFTLAGVACTDGAGGLAQPTPPTAFAPNPAPAPNPVPAPNPAPSFPSITVGEPVRFQFTQDDRPCVGASGRCKSYNVTAPANGQMEVVLRSVSGDAAFTVFTEMYVVPGADWWNVSGSQLIATLPALAGSIYEIRMYSPVVPSVELELVASLR